MKLQCLCLVCCVGLLGCASSPNSGSTKFYQNDGPPTAHYDQTHQQPTPKVESFKASTLRPYTVLGKRYVPLAGDLPYEEQGVASWYGRQFHGQRTATGEIYNMHDFTAAHPTMPLPSYARVTNLDNGKTVIVRVNDRGPFLHNRIIDLSYAAAQSLGYANRGTAHVKVQRLTFNDIRAMNAPKPTVTTPSQPVVAQATLDEHSLNRGTMHKPTLTESVNPERLAVTSHPVAATQTPPVMPPESVTAITTQTPLATTAGGDYKIQFGFFTHEERAQALVGHLEAVSESLDTPLQLSIEKTDKGYRVLSQQSFGLQEARMFAQRINAALNLQTFPYRWRH